MFVGSRSAVMGNCPFESRGHSNLSWGLAEWFTAALPIGQQFLCRGWVDGGGGVTSAKQGKRMGVCAGATHVLIPPTAIAPQSFRTMNKCQEGGRQP